MDQYMGEITMFGFNWNPQYFARCNGNLLQIAQYNAMFALLGTTFGGDGRTTFQLPNLGGRLVIGQGQSPGTSNYSFGQATGTEQVTLVSNQMPMHTHVAATTVTPTTNATATTVINALTAPTARTPLPTGNLPTVPLTAAINGTQYGVQSYAAPGAGTAVTMAPGMATTTVTATTSAPATTTIQPAGGNTPFSVVQPVLALNYAIVMQGLFPSRT